ncbi:MAG: hypothetical protein ACREYF_09515, partial [Gammaproteobacteria bacterium]
ADGLHGSGEDLRKAKLAATTAAARVRSPRWDYTLARVIVRTDGLELIRNSLNGEVAGVM